MNVLFLPGAGGSAEFWRPVAHLLPADRKTLLHWPGLGAEPPSPDIQSIDDLIDCTIAALRPTGNILVAQSMGGYIALRVALARPQQVTHLVLAVTSGGIDATETARATHDWHREYRQTWPNAADWILDPVPDVTTRLAEITCPVLLLYGSADPIAPAYVGERFQQLLPNAQLHVLEGSGHDLAHKQAQAVTELILGFLG